MDMRYLMYAFANKYYYVPQRKNTRKTMLDVPQLPEGWINKLDDNRHWMYCFRKGTVLPKQGWKIHLSCLVEDAQKTLDTSVPIFFENNVMFKYVCSGFELSIKNSKYGDRGASGKFITAYPQDEKQFIKLLDLLNEATEDIKKGPYILSDKRWKDNNIYFRYGGFIEMYSFFDGRKELAIIDDKGEYVADRRGPVYIVPDFVQEPEAIKQMDKEREIIEEKSSPLDNYKITEALHFSNGGGVYLAIDNRDNKKVVIKEGRPGAGIDATGRDAFQRVRHEVEILKKLINKPHIVQIINYFDSWEHTFLVEEYVEGMTLNKWLGLKYPFTIGLTDTNAYSENVITILTNIQSGLLSMHSSGVALGDLSLTNILVNTDLDIKFIDFEAADDVESTKSSGLATIGFVSPLTKTREETDWFGLLRIARQLFLPIGDVNDLKSSIEYKHDRWIEDTYGTKAINKVREIEKICMKKIALFFKYKPNAKISYSSKNYSISNIMKKLREAMISDIKLTKCFLHGDIRQYEFKGGKLNVLTGGYGMVMALFRTGELPKMAYTWAQKYCEKKYITGLDDGLFTGKAGIATVLYEIGLKQEAKEVFDSIDINKELGDVSVISGLAGIGLALLSVSSDPIFEDFLPKCIKIANQLKEALVNNIKIITLDSDFVTMGLIDGWAGVSLFFTALYRATNNKVWMDLSITALSKDIDNCKLDDIGVMQIDDKTRYLPYLAGGSIGIAIAIYQIRDLGDSQKWSKEFESISKLIKTRICYNPGLFRGMCSFLELYNVRHCYDGYVSKQDIDRILNQLMLFMVENGDKIRCPGDYGYRYSYDLFSGSAGVLLALKDTVQNTTMSWMPLPSNPFLLD